MSTKPTEEIAVPPVKSKRGGARVGAGRPVKAHVTVADGTPALDFLTQVFESDTVPLPLRIKAAALVVSATVARPGADKLGKRATALANARELSASGGIFSAGRSPLSVVGKP